MLLLRIVFAIPQTSAASEHVFAFLKAIMFCADQHSCLSDYIEAALMLRYLLLQQACSYTASLQAVSEVVPGDPPVSKSIKATLPSVIQLTVVLRRN